MVNFIILLKVFTQIQNALLNKAKRELMFCLIPKVYDRNVCYGVLFFFNIYINEFVNMFERGSALSGSG
jgi:hypothetical protein